jgi:hypothetical protein
LKPDPVVAGKNSVPVFTEFMYDWI